MTQVVVVGVDGSANADEALAWALDHARRTGAVVRVVSAWAWEDVVGVPGARFPTETEQDAVDRAHGVIDDALERAGDDRTEGVRIERVVAQVPAAQVLLDTAADADLLVLGSRGLGGFRGLLLGSVSQQCVTHATCPTVVVPHPRTAGEQVA